MSENKKQQFTKEEIISLVKRLNAGDYVSSVAESFHRKPHSIRTLVARLRKAGVKIKVTREVGYNRSTGFAQAVQELTK